MSFRSPQNRRRVLCLFPRHTQGFALRFVCLPLLPDTRALMPPQGILTIAIPSRKLGGPLYRREHPPGDRR